MLTRNIASEYGEYNIQCNGIGRGYIATPQTAPLREKTPDGSRHPFDAFIVAKTPAARWGTPEDLMGPAVFLASDASNFVNGHVLYVDGGIHSLHRQTTEIIGIFPVSGNTSKGWLPYGNRPFDLLLSLDLPIPSSIKHDWADNPRTVKRVVARIKSCFCVRVICIFASKTAVHEDKPRNIALGIAEHRVEYHRTIDGARLDRYCRSLGADSTKTIGALAIGVSIFNFIYWNCSFVRMGTSGLTAQAFRSRKFSRMHQYAGTCIGRIGRDRCVDGSAPISGRRGCSVGDAR